MVILLGVVVQHRPQYHRQYYSVVLTAWPWFVFALAVLVSLHKASAGTPEHSLTAQVQQHSQWQHAAATAASQLVQLQLVKQLQHLLLSLVIVFDVQEMAAFEWTSDSVTAKDLSGNVFFHASLAAAEQTQPLPVWLNMYVRNGFHTLQWPIKDASITIGDLLSVGVRVAKTPEIAAEAAAEAKVAASLLHGTLAGATGAAVVSEGVDGPSNLAVLVPNRQTLSFPNYESLVLAKATAVWFDSFKFTGRENMTVALAEPADIGYLKGVPGQLNDPALFTCKQLLN